MAQVNAKALVDAFTNKLPILEAFSKKMCTLVNELLEAEGIRTHSVTERVKKQKNFVRRLHVRISITKSFLTSRIR
jgi:hypothetical protein